METAIYEVKPLLSAYVTIFTLTLNKDIQIIDFSKITSGAVRLAACKKPDEYLFWDGIHPTTSGHQILSMEVLEAISK